MASDDDASRGHDLPVHPPTGPVTKNADSQLQPEVKKDPETKEQPTHDDAQATDTTLKETTAADDDSDANTVKGWRLVAILIGVCVGSFLMSVDVFIIATVGNLLSLATIFARADQYGSLPTIRQSRLSRMLSVKHPRLLGMPLPIP